jgi:DNA-binding SARP family transcriptional activator
MFLRLLGPVEVRIGESWSGIGAPKWRALLATLLLDRSQVVPVERLIDELWPNSPPAGARKLVSGYAAQLRGMIGDSGGRVLVTRSPGYALLASRADVDAWCFEDLLAAGRSALHEHDASLAATRLGEALALWRGPALADVPRGPGMIAQVERLEELRLTATELWYEAGLAGGRGGELVPGLRRLVMDHQLNVLAEELGVVPGPDLQRMHYGMLSLG